MNAFLGKTLVSLLVCALFALTSATTQAVSGSAGGAVDTGLGPTVVAGAGASLEPAPVGEIGATLIIECVLIVDSGDDALGPAGLEC